jgi:electron transport complex protein RnfE
MSEVNALPGPGDRFWRGILPENPTLRQLIGMCPTLAVTGAVAGAVTMAIAATFVLVMSNIFTSLMRKAIQPHMRILVFTVTIAVFVTIADLVLQAFFLDMSILLGPFVPLIIVNCIIIARAEICAAKQGVWVATCDGIGNGIGFLLVLAAMASIREILGNGTWFGLTVLPPAVWPKWTIMVLPPADRRRQLVADSQAEAAGSGGGSRRVGPGGVAAGGVGRSAECQVQSAKCQMKSMDASLDLALGIWHLALE